MNIYIAPINPANWYYDYGCYYGNYPAQVKMNCFPPVPKEYENMVWPAGEMPMQKDFRLWKEKQRTDPSGMFSTWKA